MQAEEERVRRFRGFSPAELLALAALVAALALSSVLLAWDMLERARCAADAEAERAARTAAFLRRADAAGADGPLVYLYDAAAEELIPAPVGFDLSARRACGRCGRDGHRGKFLWVRLDPETGEIWLGWSAGRPGSAGAAWNRALCGARRAESP